MSVPIVNNNLQVGSVGGRVLLGMDRQPFMSMSAHEALMMASLLLKHAATILNEADKSSMVEKASDEVFGPIPDSPVDSSGN